MTRLRETCPHLPIPNESMSYRCLTELREGDAETLYVEALRYGHYLWLGGHSGRAILSLTRGLYADIKEGSNVLAEWPLPYRALSWIVANHLGDDFPGNPRVSFQHQATRLRGERMELRRARAWAVWALIRAAKPSLPADLTQDFVEPSLDEIEQGLVEYGHSGECELWRAALSVDGQ